MRKINQFDLYIEAVRLLARADVHLEFAEARDDKDKSLLTALRSDIERFMKKRAA